jgi:hypothetical protein
MHLYVYSTLVPEKLGRFYSYMVFLRVYQSQVGAQGMCECERPITKNSSFQVDP